MDTEKKLNETKILLRSVLMSSQEGVKMQRVQSDFRDFASYYIDYKLFGFDTLHKFIASLKDVVRVHVRSNGEVTYHAVADATTARIKNLVDGQKLKKKKAPKRVVLSFKKSMVKPMQSRPRQRPNNYYPKFGSNQNRYYRQNSFSNPLTKSYQPRNNDNIPSIHHRPQASRRVYDGYINPLIENYPAKRNYMNRHPRVPPKTESLPKSSSTQLEKSKPDASITSLKNVDHYKCRLKKVLDVEGGIHAENIKDLYKKKFNETLPEKMYTDLVAGKLNDVATVEITSLTNKTKTVLYLCKSGSSSSAEVFDFSNIKISKHKALEVGKTYNVEVSCFFDCDELYVQLEDEKGSYDKMKQNISNSNCDKSRKIITGTYVITPSNQRAKVLAVRGEIALVYHVDEGTSEQLRVEDLVFMHPKYSNNSEFSVCCLLHRPEGRWNPITANSCEKMLSKQKLKMKVISATCATSSKDNEVEHSVIFKNEEDINLNSKLLNLEFELLKSNCKNSMNPESWQPKSTVDLTLNEIYQLFILSAPCTTEIEACLIGEGYTDELVKLETKMKDFYLKGKGVSLVPNKYPLNCVYAVISSDSCTRARLISILKNNESGDQNKNLQAKVYLVDNGEFEIVDLDSLRVLTEDFVSLPMQAVLVGLAGLDADTLCSNCKVLEFLKNEVLHKTFAAKIVGSIKSQSLTESRYLNMVELIKVSEDTNEVINQTCIDIILNHELTPSIPKNQNFENFKISNLDAEHDQFHVQVYGNGLRTLKSMLNQQKSVFSRINPKDKLAHNLYVGKICLAIISNELHRVEVIEINKDDKCRDVTVFLIDKGSEKKVGRCNLYKLESESLFCIPRQALCCKIADEPIDPNMACLSLKQAKKYLDKIYKNQLFVVFKDEFSVFHVHKTVVYIDNKAYQIIPSQCESKYPITPIAENKANSKMSIENSLSKKMAKSCTVTPIEIERRNKLIRVKVLEVESPDKLQIISTENLKLRDQLRIKMNKFYQNSFTTLNYVENVINGKLYALLIIEKSMPNWYRVRIESQMEGYISCYIVDYGTFTIVKDKSRFRLLDTSFSSSKDMVCFAKLGGIRPKKPVNSWPSEVKEKFSTIVSFKYFFCETLDAVKDPYVPQRTWMSVALCDTTGKKDVWINDLIVDTWKCAEYVGN